MTTNNDRVLRDIPLGREGTRGRLLMVTPDAGGNHRFVFYRGTNSRAKVAVAGCDVSELRELHERREDVERRSAIASDLAYAIGEAINLPAADDDVVTILRYLEATTREGADDGGASD